MKELILLLRKIKDTPDIIVTHAQLGSYLTLFLHCVADIKDITNAIKELDGTE
jgi:hypothetical protein